MTKPSIIDLTHFGLLRFSGLDAQQFLHTQLSCDVNALQAGQAQYGSYSTPQGRMLASFLLWRDEAKYVMQLSRALAEPICKRLSKYIMRANVTATDESSTLALIGIAGVGAEPLLLSLFPELPQAMLAYTEAKGAKLLRVAADRYEIIVNRDRADDIQQKLASGTKRADHAVWERFDIRDGIPYITPATEDQFVPQMANLDLIGGVSFSKGCYPGQEIVARSHYLGRLKQRMYLAHVAGDTPPQPGDKLYGPAFGDQACGTIMNAAPAPDGGHDVLAVMQIASAAGGDVHIGSLTGSKLNFAKLPYEIA